MKVLFAASEAVPFIKSGGLGDVIGSLPQALKEYNLDVRVILPQYSDIPEEFRKNMIFKKSITVDLGWRKQYCGIKELSYKGIPFYFIDNEYYFKRQGIYGFYDEAERFAFFSRAILASLPHIEFKPQIIHTHDWQTALVSLFLKALYGDNPFYKGIATMFTIHNLKYQGVFPKEILGDILGLGPEFLAEDKLQFYDNVNFMKAGLAYADLITTVSPTYAEEIKDPYFGENLDGILRTKDDKLYGILNGIDYKKYNPLKDQHIFVNYKSSLKKKEENKVKLQELFKLPPRPEVPVIAIVSRLVEQKGFDLVAHVLDDILNLDIQLIILGTGQEKYETLFKNAAQSYPDKIAANITFSEPLAHKIYAGADLFLMPSLFEPCGLSQLIALRYGTIPIVRETGGLKDTVKPYNELSQEGNGFSFTNYNAHDMLFTIKRALRFYQDKEQWSKVVKNALSSKYSWENSAQEYIKLYNSVLY